MNCEIRALMPEDWIIFSNIRLRALKECPSVYSSSYEKEQHMKPEEWQSWLNGEINKVFGLFDHDELIGIAGVATERDHLAHGILWGDYIEPQYRGRGLSQLLYAARIEWATKNVQWKKLVIGHREENEASRRANQRHDFVMTHREPQLWPDGTTADHIHYELDLERLRITS